VSGNTDSSAPLVCKFQVFNFNIIIIIIIIIEEGDVAVLWNQAVHTDREVTASRPDIIIKKKKKEKTCTLIDVAIPTDRNVVQKEA